MMISAAFQYKGWSKVTMVGRLCFMARLQTKYNVDTMHDLSPEYILIIAKNLTDNCPRCWLPRCKICIISCQCGVASLKPRDTSHRISILLSQPAKKSRHVLEDYLMTSMPCKPVLQDRNVCLVFSFQF